MLDIRRVNIMGVVSSICCKDGRILMGCFLAIYGGG